MELSRCKKFNFKELFFRQLMAREIMCVVYDDKERERETKSLHSLQLFSLYYILPSSTQNSLLKLFSSLSAEKKKLRRWQLLWNEKRSLLLMIFRNLILSDVSC